jgi:undecaprenyl-diphosphatase
LPATLISLFARYGYLVIFGAVLLENAGVPSPGHTVMLAGGALAQQGHLRLALVIATGALAAILGDNIGYIIGHRGGRALLLKYGHRFFVTPKTVEKAERFFERHGPKAVFLARFVTGLQTVGALLAGASRMHWRTFFVWNLLGALAWATCYAVLGYLFGASWQMLERWVGHAGLFLAAILAIGVGVLMLRRRASIGRQLDRYLPAALDKRQAALGLVALGSAALFAKIAEDVVNRESTQFDRAVSLWVHRFDTPSIDLVMRLFTFIGSFPVIALVAIVVLTWCWRRGDRDAFAGLLGVIAVNEALNFALKHLFGRPRPNLFEEIATLHSYSFPSGHAMAAAAIYGMIAVVIARLAPSLRLWVGLAAVALALLIGLSRVYLGVHWITDVLAGYAAGATILFGGILWLEFRHSNFGARSKERRPSPKIR